MNYDQYTGKKIPSYIYTFLKFDSESNLQIGSKSIFFSAELKSILGHSGKRKAPELLSDGLSFKRQANVHPHLLVSFV